MTRRTRNLRKMRMNQYVTSRKAMLMTMTVTQDPAKLNSLLLIQKSESTGFNAGLALSITINTAWMLTNKLPTYLNVRNISFETYVDLIFQFLVFISKIHHYYSKVFIKSNCLFGFVTLFLKVTCRKRSILSNFEISNSSEKNSITGTLLKIITSQGFDPPHPQTSRVRYPTGKSNCDWPLILILIPRYGLKITQTPPYQ